ncbi:MAG: DUF6077 domain-containing protein [Acidobacteriota bacterium]
MTRSRPAGRWPWLQAIKRGLDATLDLSVWGFALWTVLCWVLVATGASFALLVALSPLVLGALWLTRGVVSAGDDELPGSRLREATAIARSDERARWPAVLGLSLGLLAVGVGFGLGQWRLAWLLALGSLLIAAASERWRPTPSKTSGNEPSHDATRPRRHNAARLGVLLWVLVAMLVASSVSRPDADDGGYHSISWAAAEDPMAPLLCCETLHGSGMPLVPPTQQLKSLELLVAVPVLLFDVPPWTVFHFLLPLWGAAGLCLAHRRLAQILAPERWFSALSVTLLLMMTLGTAHAWHGNFGLVRLHQGKGLLVSVLLPLICVYGIQAAATGGVRRWLRLLGAQIAAIGLNQAALVVAPGVALLAVLTGLPERAVQGTNVWRRIGWAPVIAALPVLIGAAFWPSMSWRFERAVGTQTSEQLIRTATTYVFGDGTLPLLVALAVLVCPWCVRPGLPCRWALLAPLAVLAGPLNPWLAHWVAASAFGSVTFWRCFWLLPLIPTLALVLTVAEGWRPRAPKAAPALSLLMLLALLFAVDEWILSSENRTDWAPLEIKVPPVEGAAAAALAGSVPARSIVLAPRRVGRWLGIARDRPFQWAIAPRFPRHSLGFRDERVGLGHLTMGREQAQHREALARRLALFSGVMLHRNASANPEIEALLRQRGFEQGDAIGPYQLWIRRPSR